MKFLIKIECSDELSEAAIVQELRDGVHCLVGMNDPEDRFYQLFSKIKITYVPPSVAQFVTRKLR